MHHLSLSQEQREHVSEPGLWIYAAYPDVLLTPQRQTSASPVAGDTEMLPKGHEARLASRSMPAPGARCDPSILAFPAALKFPLGPCQAFTPRQLWWYLDLGITGKR